MNRHGAHAERASFVISAGFRATIEGRILRLEADASEDEQAISLWDDEDHICRQRTLVATQRDEALRMRRFLDRASARLPRPRIAL